MTDSIEGGSSFQLGPTPEDVANFAATNTSLAQYFRPDDGYPLEFPVLQTDENLIFDYRYDSEETGKEEVSFTVVTSVEQMREVHVGVKHNFVGVIGWRVVASPELPELE